MAEHVPVQPQPAGPRQSKNIPESLAQSDGDVWSEKIAVCESVTDEGAPKLVLRSYFRNARTEERVWDEPPSGAGIIKHASDEMRHTATIERDQLQLTLNMIPPDDDNFSSADEQQQHRSSGDKKKKKSLFGRLRKKKEKPTLKDESKDLNLQKAIARSMAEASGNSSISADQFAAQQANGQQLAAQRRQRELDDELELAKAISASEAAYEQEERRKQAALLGQEPPQLREEQGLTDEEIFQRAVAATKNLKKPPPTSKSPPKSDYSSTRDDDDDYLMKQAISASAQEQYAVPGGEYAHAQQKSIYLEEDDDEEEMVMAHSSGRTARPNNFVGKTDPNERYYAPPKPAPGHPSARCDDGIV